MSSSNHTEALQVGGVGGVGIASMLGNNANVSSQDYLVQSAGNVHYSAAHGSGDAIQDGQQASDMGSSSGSVPSSSSASANIFDGGNTNAVNNNGTAIENQLFAYNWLDFLSGAAD
ncbi:hypothetical protein BD410DRAFT_845712 [Rickenella mellea]|uniref:Uncharacterized protein n=1 Tax=Rickenella mellea TaxID=50990 RepID=A0A4Y7PH59_9AGAM|nr:hypothetical protein BD410DRAFT_845712 [Rickenella mellea]